MFQNRRYRANKAAEELRVARQQVEALCSILHRLEDRIAVATDWIKDVE